MDASTQKNKVFFPNLDGLRFICFLAVFLYHCNETIFPNISNSTTRAVLNFLFRNGNLGVNIFFVLSGFLITFLLIKEKEIRGTISLGNFYLRRILRIWPLFYLCIFLGFVIFPLIKYKSVPSPFEISNVWSYLFFAGNFDFIKIWPSPPDALNLLVLWSVAVEEQFYLTWPVILKYLSKKNYPLVFLIIISGTLVFRTFYISSYPVLHFNTLSVIGDMALGGLVAYACSMPSVILYEITRMKRSVIILIYLIAIVVILLKDHIFLSPATVVFERIILGTFFAFVIAEQNFANNSFFKFSNFKIISRLGIYTYGLYCLHFIGILVAEKISDKLHLSGTTLLSSFVITLIALLATILLALISYHFFEKWFLKLKDRFAIITRR